MSDQEITPIPLFVPTLAGNEWKYVKQCLDTGWISSVGSFVVDFEESVARFVGVKHAIAASNGSAALHIALQVAGVRPGDYVIIPNLTFVATANSVSYTGAEPILIDVDDQTWQLDLNLLEHFLTEKCSLADGKLVLQRDGRRVAAIMPVHVLGLTCDLNRLEALCARFNLPMVEDSTEALGSTYDGRAVGSIGAFGTFSFNGNKIISTGGGGMIVTNDSELARRAKHLTTQAKVSERGYYHDEIGYNYRLVNVLAAIGLAQMEQLPGFLKRKREVGEKYRVGLSKCADITFPVSVPKLNSNDWLYTIRTRHASALIERMKSLKIDCRAFWVPMNQLPMYQSKLYVTASNVSNRLYTECVSIPSSVSVSDQEVERVIDAVKDFFKVHK